MGLSVLTEARRILDGILLETTNATEHMSSSDVEMLRSVISLVQDTIYKSMDDSQAADAASLDSAVGAVKHCNDDIAARQSPTGDLGAMEQAVTDKQAVLDA